MCSCIDRSVTILGSTIDLVCQRRQTVEHVRGVSSYISSDCILLPTGNHFLQLSENDSMRGYFIGISPEDQCCTDQQEHFQCCVNFNPQGKEQKKNRTVNLPYILFKACIEQDFEPNEP